MHYVTTIVPLVTRDEGIDIFQGNLEEERMKRVKVSSAFELMGMLSPEDDLWIRMGSVNSHLALGAFRKGVQVHQVSFPRLKTWLSSQQRDEDVKAEHILRAAIEAPELFYPTSAKQAEVLDIVSHWIRLSDAMEARKAAANILRSRLYGEAVEQGTIRGKKLPDDWAESQETVQIEMNNLLSNKDENGRRCKPGDPHIAFLFEAEEGERKNLENICDGSGFFQYVFGDIQGVGPNIGARFVAGIERIERFKRPEDLSNFAGMLPRGREGKLPKRTKGKVLSRNPLLNMACFLLQNYMFQWGRNMPLGMMISEQIEAECPCTSEDRKASKDLRKQYAGAVARAKIRMTRYFLEQIVWPMWQEYLGKNS